MLFLIFHAGADRFALETSRVVSVIPAVAWTVVPGVADGVAGLFNYHGDAVPLVDFTLLLTGVPSALRMSTRIVLVRVASDTGDDDVRESDADTLLGVLAERVVGTIRRDEADFVPAGEIAAGAPYVGPVLADGEGIIQRVTVDQLLPAPVRARLRRVETT